MASGFVISLLVGCGSGFWMFQRFQRSSGGNKKNSAIASVVVAILITVVGTIVLDMVFKKFHK